MCGKASSCYRFAKASNLDKFTTLLFVKSLRLRLSNLLTALAVDAVYARCRKSGGQQHKCFLEYAKRCVNAKHIVTKVTRLDICHTKVLLLKYPSLKVVQLMRDPRGIVNSRLSRTRWYPVSEKSNDTKRIENIQVLCSKMRSDIEGARELAREFPNRVRIIQYEDIVQTYEKRNALYRYIGVTALKGHHPIPQLVSTIPTAGPYSFRNQMSQSTLYIVQKHCSDVIQILGLRVFRSYDEMKNVSIQVQVRTKLPYAL